MLTGNAAATLANSSRETSKRVKVMAHRRKLKILAMKNHWKSKTSRT